MVFRIMEITSEVSMDKILFSILLMIYFKDFHLLVN